MVRGLIFMRLIKNLFQQKDLLKNILSIFIVSRLLIIFIGYLSTLIIVKGKFFEESNSLLDLFFQWDSRWYMLIVKSGYYYIPGEESSVAFFPLYPMLVKIFALIFDNPILIGFIISNLALVLAATYLYKLIMLDFPDPKIALKTVFYMLIFPVSFFFSIFYTEGLFLFLVVSSFYYARKRLWLRASILGFFLALTRAVGVFILVPFLIEYLNIDFKSFKINLKTIKKDLLYLLLIPAGLFTYMFYLSIKFNDALAYIHIQSAWGKGFTSIFKTVSSIKYYSPFYNIIFLGSIIFALLLVIYLIYFRVRISYIVYASLLLFLYLSTGRLDSLPRFIGVLFPLYLGMSLLANKKEFWDYLFTSFSIMLLTLFTILFVNGYWFV